METNRTNFPEKKNNIEPLDPVEHPTYGAGMVEDIRQHVCLVNFMSYGLMNVYAKNLVKIPFKKREGEIS